MREREDKKQQDAFQDRVISVSRVSKTVKGGRRMSFSALVVVGDGEGTVGYGHGKAAEVPEAVRKAVAEAKKNLVKIPIEDETIPFIVEAKVGASKLFIKPAAKGKGVVAGGALRAVAELAGIPNLTGKVTGSRNAYNVVRSAFAAFKELKLRSEYIEIRK